MCGETDHPIDTVSFETRDTYTRKDKEMSTLNYYSNTTRPPYISLEIIEKVSFEVKWNEVSCVIFHIYLVSVKRLVVSILSGT